MDIDDDSTALRAQLAQDAFEHVLVSTGDIDHVVGILDTRDLPAHTLADQPLTADALRSLAREPLFVPATMPTSTAMQMPDFARQPDGSWLVNGAAPLVDVASRLDLEATEREVFAPTRSDDGPAGGVAAADVTLCVWAVARFSTATPGCSVRRATLRSSRPEKPPTEHVREE